MSSIYSDLITELAVADTRLIIVSKTRPIELVQDYYTIGHRDFAENRVQALLERKEQLPEDIKWHMIGHLQRNKVKDIAPFIYMIHSGDSMRLLKEINNQAQNLDRIIPVLLQIKVAQEDSKYGFSTEELIDHIKNEDFFTFKNLQICGLLAMATFTDNTDQIHQEFKKAKQCFNTCKELLSSEHFKELSIGMSGDYKIALKHGATMVRIGSLLF